MISIIEISILTLNIWLVDLILNNKHLNEPITLYRGIPLVSKDRKVRINAISKELARGEYDVVSLQEVSEIIKSLSLLYHSGHCFTGLERCRFRIHPKCYAEHFAILSLFS